MLHLHLSMHQPRHGHLLRQCPVQRLQDGDLTCTLKGEHETFRQWPTTARTFQDTDQRDGMQHVRATELMDCMKACLRMSCCPNNRGSGKECVLVLAACFLGNVNLVNSLAMCLQIRWTQSVIGQEHTVNTEPVQHWRPRAMPHAGRGRASTTLDVHSSSDVQVGGFLLC